MLSLVCRHRCWIALHHIIARSPRHAVFIRAVVNRRASPTKIVMRRWRPRRPLKRGRLPRIVTRLLPVLHAPEQIEEKDKLRPDRDEGYVSDELLERQQRMKKSQLRSLRIPPRMSGHPQIMHRHEDRVRPDKREPKMPSGETFAHHPPKHFREPIISRGKNPENRCHAHNQVEVPRHKVSVMQRNIERRLRQKRPTDSA